MVTDTTAYRLASGSQYFGVCVTPMSILLLLVRAMHLLMGTRSKQLLSYWCHMGLVAQRVDPMALFGG